MTGSVNSGDLQGGGLGSLALAICILAAVALLVPFGLDSIGFAAILGVAGGLEAPSMEHVGGQQLPAGGTGLAALVPPPLAGASDTGLPYASELLAQARSWLGTRYLFGGCSPSGIDCSCFVQTIFRSIGIGLPRTSQSQYSYSVGRGFGTASPEPGDLVFFFRTYSGADQDWAHVGVVSRVDSNGTVRMIDAPGARAAGDPPDALFGQVREEPIAVPGSSIDQRTPESQVDERR